MRRLLAIFIVGAITASCATGDFAYGPGQQEARAQSLAASGRHDESAAIYIGLASDASGRERDRLTLLAVQQWLDAGDGRRARRAFSEVAQPADGELRWLWSTNSAALALWHGRPDEALAILDPLSRQALPAKHRANIEALRGDAWFQKDDPRRAVDIYMQRERWLDDDAALERNRQRLWAGLMVSDARNLRQAAEVASDVTERGWLALGSLAASTGQQGVGWRNGVERWQNAFPGHPAGTVLGKLDLPEAGSLEYPRQVALLLPLSGNNAGNGNAVKNGFFGAYFATAPGLDEQQRIIVYDVAQGGANAAYRRAIEDGAEFVVGPLLPRNVAEIAGERFFPVPVLALNNLRNRDDMIADLYQFGLPPEQEAAAAARRALKDGHEYAIALYPDDDWGTRVITAFATEFENGGGTLLDHQRYTPSDSDYSVEIRNILSISESMQRHRRLEANLGEQIEFEPRRRQDAEVIFLAANSRSGRLLSSQLKFHEASDLQIYSTSYIYSMDGRSDRDLNGVMFADVPWIIAPPPWIADFPPMFQEFWPAERRLGRLHALGHDAYQLIAPLYSGQTAPMDELAGATGQLTLDLNGRVQREPAWAQFQGGVPTALPEPPEFELSGDFEEVSPDTGTWSERRAAQ